MRIAYVADARSPIARNWIDYFIKRGHEVSVISSYPCSPDILAGAKVISVPLAFSQFSRIKHDGTLGSAKRLSKLKPLLASLRTGAASHIVRVAWNVIAPLEIYRHIRRIHDLLVDLSPDLTHAMRIPFEGIVAAEAIPSETPLVMSVWGNDFTLIGSHNMVIARQTRRALRQTDALHCDCQRDLRLSHDWNFAAHKPAVVLPGAGGIRGDVFYPGPRDEALRERLHIPCDAPVVINPRGHRSYVRNDMFFQAIPHVLRERPDTIFVCLATQGNPTVEKWVAQLGVARHVRLLPSFPHEEVADLFRLSQITVSPSLHDGTPNTLLEAMACGCFPIAGDIDSVREWITDGVNGLLCDASKSETIANAILYALNHPQFRQEANLFNLQLIRERAEYSKVMLAAEQFYHKVVECVG